MALFERMTSFSTTCFAHRDSDLISSSDFFDLPPDFAGGDPEPEPFFSEPSPSEPFFLLEPDFLEPAFLGLRPRRLPREDWW